MMLHTYKGDKIFVMDYIPSLSIIIKTLLKASLSQDRDAHMHVLLIFATATSLEERAVRWFTFGNQSIMLSSLLILRSSITLRNFCNKDSNHTCLPILPALYMRDCSFKTTL
jgi:hypothetical protein